MRLCAQGGDRTTCSTNIQSTNSNADGDNKSSSSSLESAPKKTLYLLSLLPYPDPEGREVFQPSWDEGPTLFLAEQLAVELINNNRSDILNGYTLELLQGDSGCNLRSKANRVFFEKVLYNTKTPLGIVGPGCSNSALTVSSLSGRRDLSILTLHVAGSLLLSNRTLYNYSFGTLDSTEVFVQASLALVRENDWVPMGILFDESRLYYASTVRRFEEELRRANISHFSSAVYDTHIPLDVIVMNRIRVIFLFVGPDYLSRILCLAYHRNMLYPVYQFVIVSRVVEEIQPVTFNTVTCVESEITQVINGSLILHYQLKNNENQTDAGLSYKQFFKEYKQRVSDYNSRERMIHSDDNITTSFWAASFFDAVWSMALALNSSAEILDLLSADNVYGSEVADILKENLLNQNFNGLSGRITYNKSSGYVIRNVKIYQIGSTRQMSQIASYVKLNDSVVLTSTDGKFINGTFRTESTIAAVSLAIGGVFLSVIVMSFIVTLILHILTVVHREQKSVKASSTKLSHIAFAGCYLFAFCGLINFMVRCLSGIISPSAECSLFHVLNSAAALGGTLLFGPICARTWRLYRIYEHFKNPGKLLSDWFLLLAVLTLFALNSIIAVLSFTINSFEPVYVNSSYLREVRDTQGNTEEFVLIERVTINCSQSNYFVWFGVLFMFAISLMFFAFWLAVFTRRIPHRDFQTQSIILLIYLLSGFSFLGLLLYFVFNNILLRFAVLSVVFTVSVLSPCLLLFFPPLYPILKPKLPCFRPLCANSGNYV